MDQPIRICRVCNRDPLPASQCCELSVVRVKQCKFGRFGKIFVFPRLVFRERYSLDAPRSAVEDFQVEPVTDPGLSARAQVPVIFGLDLSRQIQDYAAPRQRLLKKFDRGQPTHWRCMLAAVFRVRTAIGDDWHIGIDGNTAYCAAAMRRRRAFSASAASPNASPMKLVGQFSIFPKRSNCSRSSIDPRSVTSQK